MSQAMRLTIARKIALAVTAIVILCVGTMAWVVSSNLKRGFAAYLNELQVQDFDQLRELLEDRYRSEGNFEWLRGRPRGLGDLLNQMNQHSRLFETDSDTRRPRRPRPPPPRAYAEQGEAPGDDVPQPADDRDEYLRPPRPGPLRRAEAPPRDEAPSPRAGTLPRDETRPPRAGTSTRYEAPPRAGAPPRDEAQQSDIAGTRPGTDALPLRADGPPQPAPEPPPPAPPRRDDPMDFAGRVTIVDAQGGIVIGPRGPHTGVERAIKVDGVVVGHMWLLPLRETSGAGASATAFLRGQLQSILLLAAVLIGLAILAAIWLARHLLRPVAALRDVTARLALGEFSARAPLLSQDEVAELALHVNAMAVALEESERQRRKMLADVSHELRTPLTVIRGEIEALVDGIRKADGKALQSLHAEVLRLNKLVDDLHQLTMADAGDLQYHWHDLNLTELLRPTLERYQQRAHDRGLDLSWRLPPTTLLTKGDAGRLQQVLTNLLENSLRYTDAGGQVVVALAAIGNQAEITIEDSAPGVPPEMAGRIFERLYRVDAARTRERGGSGLGLAICKALIEAHGGTISASASVLGGLKIQIRLPIKEALSGPHSHR